jgi:hypothetical protein
VFKAIAKAQIVTIPFTKVHQLNYYLFLFAFFRAVLTHSPASDRQREWNIGFTKQTGLMSFVTSRGLGGVV